MPTFWDLPKNVRDIIYHYHLVYDKPITIDMHREAIGSTGEVSRAGKCMPPIFHLSKKVEREAAPFYYGTNVLDIGTMLLGRFNNVTWRRHWNQVRRVQCTWDAYDGWGRYGSTREVFISLSKMKKLEEVNIRIDETKMADEMRLTREVRQHPSSTFQPVTDQQNLAILRFPGITGLLTLSRIKNVNFTKLISPDGIETGGMIPGGALEVHILPRLKQKPQVNRRNKDSFFRFLDLPPELRNNVYHLLLRVSGPIHPSKEVPTSLKLTESNNTESALALLSVCKLVNEEAVGVYYSCNSFVFHYPVQLSAFLLAIGPHRKKMIRDITVYYHNIKLGGVELIDLTFPLLTQLPSLKKLHVLMIARLADTNLRRGWLQQPWKYHGRWPPTASVTHGTNPALIPGMRTLFQIRDLTDVKVRDLELEKEIKELEQDKSFPNFPKNSASAAVVRLSKAFEHFNAALADAQLGKVNEKLFENREWQMWDTFPTLDSDGVVKA